MQAVTAALLAIARRYPGHPDHFATQFMRKEPMQAPDEHIQAMLDLIDQTGREYARAKRYRSMLEDLKKTCLAAEMQRLQADGVKSIAAQTRDALCGQAYGMVLERLHKSIEDEVIAKTESDNKARAFEAWRTTEASARALARGGA